ncbi:hypothetical protein C1Y40_02889 [Mycobacterium talmoniae]|uniref:Uncharacterized protein n=1 Tax=Mycobacterium talmoniae TaxID=1858794 RepID=A0A2S8BJQ7_9MYCO|nr:hypothetical protein C1Y40_02889 [Mycobacterium talmoniae]
MSSGVAGSLRGAALPHRVGAHRAVRDLAADVDGQLAVADHVEVVRVALPAPGNALGQRGARDVFHTLHQLDEPLLTPGSHRRKPDTAVAHHDRGHAVGAGRLQHVVPADLPVVVGVDVHEARRDDLAGGVDGLGGRAVERRVAGPAPVDRHDLAVLNGHVGVEAVRARSVHDGAPGDLQIEHDFSSSSPIRRYSGECNTVTEMSAGSSGDDASADRQFR